MPDSTNPIPARSLWLIKRPWLAAVLSLLLPGLGQVLLGAATRGFSFMAAVVIAGGIILWQDFQSLWVLLALVWVWTAWDAYGLAQGRPRSIVPPVLALLVIVYVAGWFITEIAPSNLLQQANRAAPIVRGMLSPDFMSRETEQRRERAPFEIPCSANPPPLVAQVGDGASLTLSESCGEVGDTIAVQGSGFWPDAETEIWWANPIGQERRLAREGEALVVVTDGQGAFTVEIEAPLAVPLSTLTGEPQGHAVQIIQKQVVGGWELSENGGLVLQKMVETVAIALVATTFSMVFAIPLSFIAARNLMSGNPVMLIVYFVTRTLLNIVRSVESLIIAIIFVVWVGLGPFAGVMALTIHSVAALGKLYSEQVESIDFGPIEAIRSTGATWWQTVIYGVLPQVVPPFLAFTIYRWDINVRMSTILGFVGGGGIGFLIVQWQRLSQWSAIGAAFWSIMILVAILDYASAEARERIA